MAATASAAPSRRPAHSLRRRAQLRRADPVPSGVLGLESTSGRAEREYGLEAGEMLSYRAWMC
ncbi:hypothetical protein [Streptomyces sp. NPDC001296]